MVTNEHQKRLIDKFALCREFGHMRPRQHQVANIAHGHIAEEMNLEVGLVR